MSLSVNSLLFTRLSLKGWCRVSFQFLVRVLIVNEFIHLVVVVLLVYDHSYSSFVGGKYNDVFVVFQSLQCLFSRLSFSYCRLWKLFVG